MGIEFFCRFFLYILIIYITVADIFLQIGKIPKLAKKKFFIKLSELIGHPVHKCTLYN